MGKFRTWTLKVVKSYMKCLGKQAMDLNPQNWRKWSFSVVNDHSPSTMEQTNRPQEWHSFQPRVMISDVIKLYCRSKFPFDNNRSIWWKHQFNGELWQGFSEVTYALMTLKILQTSSSFLLYVWLIVSWRTACFICSLSFLQYQFFNRRNSSCGKVIFSQVSVILSNGRGKVYKSP